MLVDNEGDDLPSGDKGADILVGGAGKDTLKSLCDQSMHSMPSTLPA
jgi:hypothetical protein